MLRHVRQSCKIANSEEGMEKLLEHTLQRQLVTQTEKVDALQAQVSRLAALFEERLTVSQPRPARALNIDATGAGQVNAGPVTNNVTQIQQFITVQPWNGEKRIDVTTAQIAAAFAENSRLKAYAQLDDHALADPAIAPPYVTELLMDLTKRAHADPAARNVYLNPRRADQALVHMASGRWEVMALAEATRLIFDGVAKAMVRVTMSDEERQRLPLEAQNALAMAGLLYDDEPEEYAKRAKGPMAAHLANCRGAPAQLDQ